MSTVQSIERAFGVLRSLTGGPAGVTEVAERTGLPKSTVSRLLSTLEQLGAVEQVSVGGQYRVGLAMVEIAGAAQPGRSLTSTARPHLAELNRTTGEAAGISIPDGDEMLYIDQITPDSELQVRDWTGVRIPMHAVPSGQVMLAADGVLAERVATRPMQRFTPRTIVTAAALRQRLEEVRRDGYSWAMEEFAVGLNSVAAPIKNSAGRVVAALHVYGPASRFPGRRGRAELGELVVAAAMKISID